MKQGRMSRRQFAGLVGAGALVTFSPFGTRSAWAAVAITAAEAVETLLYLPLYVAHQRGFFKEQGLDVTIFNAQQRSIALRAILAKSALTYNGDPAEPARARLSGQDVRNIGVLVNRAGGDLLGKKGIDKDPKAWKGVRLVVPRPPHTSVSLIQMVLLRAGYTKADRDGLVWKPADSSKKSDLLRLIPVIAGSELAALESGSGDLSITLEPQSSIGIAHGYELITSFAELFGPFLYTSFAVTGEAIRTESESVQKFVNALTKACVFGHKYPDKAAEDGVKRFAKADPAIIRAASKHTIQSGSYPKSLVITEEAYAANFDKLLVRTGDAAAKYPFKELVYNDFARKAASAITEGSV